MNLASCRNLVQSEERTAGLDPDWFFFFFNVAAAPSVSTIIFLFVDVEDADVCEADVPLPADAKRWCEGQIANHNEMNAANPPTERSLLQHPTTPQGLEPSMWWNEKGTGTSCTLKI